MSASSFGNVSRHLRIAYVGAAIAVTAGLSLVAPVTSYANVLPSDVIVGSTVEEREIEDSQAPDISAPIAMLMDSDGRVYFSRSADEKVKIASVTKIMTAVLTIEEYGSDGLGDTVKVTKEDLAQLPADGSSAGLKEGDELTVGDALLGLMVPSGNDAAMVLARSVGQHMIDSGKADGSQSAYDTFIAAMNDKAAELGMESSVYTNPSGLDVEAFESDEMGSTASDLCKLVQHAMKNEDFRRIVSTGDTKIAVTNGGKESSLDLKTTDTMLETYDGMLGVKTGTTVEAGNCFVGAAEINGKEYYTVVLGADGKSDVFSDTKELLDWITVHNRVYDLITNTEVDGEQADGDGQNADSQTDEGTDENTSKEDTEQQDGDDGEDDASASPIVAQVPHMDWIDKTIPVTYADSDTKVYIFDLDGDFTQTVSFNTMSGDVSKGDKCGQIVFEQNGKTVETIDLVAMENVDAPSAFRSFFIGIDRFFRTLTGQPTVAETQLMNQQDEGGDGGTESDGTEADGGAQLGDDVEGGSSGSDGDAAQSN